MLDFLQTFARSKVAIANAIVAILAFIVNPFINLIYPPIKEFQPTPEQPPAIVEKHSIADYRIIYGAGATEAEINAANILADTLTQITGLDYTAMEAVPSGSKEFLIGQISGVNTSHLGSDGFILQADGDTVIITGGRPRGTLYGVHHFLQEYFDCRWYTKSLIIIPEGPAEIAQVKPREYIPPFEYRETDWLSPYDPVYSMANALNGTAYRRLSAAQGGNFGYNGGMGHTIINQFIKPAEFFESNPEWYAWREEQNARLPNQLCLTNPEMLAEMIRQVRLQLENGNGQPIVSVTQDDNGLFCQCANCKAVDAEEGSGAGTMLRFVNAIAADIAQDYPWAYIDTFAYQYTRTTPKLTKPLPNVIVRLCSFECCFAHALNDPNCRDNAAFANDLKNWSKITDRLYVWDYTTNYEQFNCIFPNFQVLQKNIQFFRDHNVKGVYEEGNYAAAESNSEFAELRGYLLSRLLFDPDIDYYAEMDGFLKAYYGGGWQYMREFIDLISANAGKSRWFGLEQTKMHIFSSPENAALQQLHPNQLSYADALWTKAIELAEDKIVGTGTETYKQHVLRSRLSWRYWKACNKIGEFNRWLNPQETWQAANEKLFYDMKDAGITRMREDGGHRFLSQPPADWWGTPNDWRE